LRRAGKRNPRNGITARVSSARCDNMSHAEWRSLPYDARSMRTAVTFVFTLFAAALGAGCATTAEAPPPSQFPTRDALQKIAASPPPTKISADSGLAADGWQLTGPLPDSIEPRVSSIDDIRFPPDLVRGSLGGVTITVTHYHPKNGPWSRLVVFILAAGQNGGLMTASR
jgi:hypothetical protein